MLLINNNKFIKLLTKTLVLLSLCIYLSTALDKIFKYAKIVMFLKKRSCQLLIPKDTTSLFQKQKSYLE